MADPQVDPHPTGDPVIIPAPVPPSVAGVTQPIIMGDGETQAIFPDFTPIVPPPLIGAGGGPPPIFPPPTPPPIGHVPVGVLVGPAIAPAGVPPSVAGIPQPVTEGDFPYDFPDFSTVFPVPTIVFTNTLLIGPLASLPNGSPPLPPSTASTQNILIGGYAPQEPPWLTPIVTPHDENAAARQWLQDNPNDPRAAQVREQLGA